MTPIRPPSVNHFYFNLFALILAAISFSICCYLKTSAHLLLLACAISYSLPILIWEYRKASKDNPSSSRLRRTSFSWKDVILKLVGLIITIATILFLYWLLPEYKKPIYGQYWNLLKYLGIITLFLAPPYFILMQWRFNEKDAYWLIGKCVFFELKSAIEEIDSPQRLFTQHCLSWLVKAFFLPVMYIFCFSSVFHFVPHVKDYLQFNIVTLFTLGVTLLFLIDLFIASLGYICTFKLFNTQILSVDATLVGWVVCLLCYHPFSNTILAQYLGDQNALSAWANWIKNDTFALIWGCIALFLLAIYTLSTVAFGLRFSNLTHRGILTDGPYRFSKHPAYISKNLFWWFATAPFGSIKAMLFLGGLNLIYYLRAKTEERHLSRDTVYVEYALWMNENGLLAPLGKVFTFLKYQKPLDPNAKI